MILFSYSSFNILFCLMHCINISANRPDLGAPMAKPSVCGINHCIGSSFVQILLVLGFVCL
jgi:hypothetical protein